MQPGVLGARRRIALGWVGTALVLLVGVLSGCATRQPTVAESASRPATPAAIEPPLSGRLSIRIDPAPGLDARQASMRFELTGSPAAGRLDLSSPVGTTLAQARWQGEQVELETAEGERRFASLEAMTRELLGEPLPVIAVLDWLRGRPWPGAPHRELAAGGGTVGFEQIGWRIDLTRYDVWSLVFTRPEPAPKVDVRVRLDPPDR
jgi:outer membrane lipoprotein LolB